MKKIITYLALITSLYNGSAFSNDQYSVDLWFRECPNESIWERNLLVQEFNKVIEREKPTPNPKEITTLKDMGYSFHYGDSILLSLIFIKTLSKTINKRPLVADIGSGTGYAAAKMAAAGAKVHLIDIEKKTLQQAKNTITDYADKGFILYPGENIEDIITYTPINIFSYKTHYKKHYKKKIIGKYQIITLWNLFHLLTPVDCERLVQQAYEMLVPGGYIFASTHTIGSCFSRYHNFDFVNFFNQQKQQGEKFPGYMSFTKKINVSSSGNTIEICEPKIAPQEKDPNTHWQINGDTWQETTVRQAVDNHNQKMSSAEPSEIQNQIHLSSIFHFFDRESLSSLFQRSGFILEDTFQVERMGKKIDPTLFTNQTIPFDQVRSVTIVARKPLI